MSNTFDVSSDGLFILREVPVKADLPSVLWYLGHGADDLAKEGKRPGPSFARARRRTNLSKKDEEYLLPDEDGQVEKGLLSRSEELTDLAAGYLSPQAFFRIEPVSLAGRDEVKLGGVGLKSARLLQLLNGCRECALFLTTLGNGIDEPIRSYQDKKDPRAARILEAVASASLLDLTQKLQRRIELIAKKERLRVTHCQWPGFCDWPEEQVQSLLPRLKSKGELKVKWRRGAFDPSWSFVGLVGLGEQVSRIKNNPCRRCDNRKLCPSRIW